jgi:flagellar protein FliS
MFSPHNPAGAYRHVGIQSDVSSANPHRLVHLLYESAISSVHAARVHLAQGNVAEKGHAIGKAITIVEEGLKASLDPVHGGDIAARLADLYDYISSRLVAAGRNNDARALEQIEHLLGTLRDAWAAIEPRNPAHSTGAPRAPFGGLVAA